MTDTTHTTTRETLGFQAEVSQLLHLMIHSLYGNKEIFLRELVSNASDAVDKLRFEALADGALFENDPDPKIRVAFDATARTITVSDNGIGMSRQEVIEHIGTIAKSGTREFFKQLTADRAKDAHLIGQFGVGFYSAFIVADTVTLVTRRAGLGAEHGVRWESTGEAGFTDRDRREGVARHRDHAPPPSRRRRAPLELPAARHPQEVLGPHRRPDPDEEGAVGRRREETGRDRRGRAGQPRLALWTRPKSDITEEQYHEVYKHVAHDQEPPLTFVHAKVEGRQEYTLLLYVPERAPFDLWDRDHRRGIKLYVRRVFIMDDAEQLMPAYLRFVRGVIDSNDLPLNVSREILQQSRDVQAIRTEAVKRVLRMLEELGDKQPEKYATFWTAFGRVLKEGLPEDPSNSERIAKLLRFSSTATTPTRRPCRSPPTSAG
jgi:molecular chaperone HtpG